MRRCSLQIPEHVVTLDSPLLPFLAPRVFAPSPTVSRGNDPTRAANGVTQKSHPKLKKTPRSASNGHRCIPLSGFSRHTATSAHNQCAGHAHTRPFNSTSLRWSSQSYHYSTNSLALTSDPSYHPTTSISTPIPVRTTPPTRRRASQNVGRSMTRSTESRSAAKIVKSSPSEDDEFLLDFLSEKAETLGTNLEKKGWDAHNYNAHSVISVLQHEHKDHNALLQYAWFLAKRGSSVEATSVMSQAISAGTPVTCLGILKLCSVLLRETGRRQYQTTSEIVATMLRHGVPMNVYHYNILMLNAFEANELSTAWRLYSLLRRNQVVPDAHTYTILLKACRRAGYKTRFRTLYRRIREAGLIHGEPALVTEVLFSFCYFGARSGYDRVLRAYERYCDLSPLKAMQMVSTDYVSRLPRLSAEPLPIPSTMTLVVLLFAYCRNARLSTISKLYSNVQRLSQQDHPAIAPLAANRHFYHVILKALSKHADFTVKWRVIVRDMRRSFAKARSKVKIIDLATLTPLEPCAPNLQTFNIVLNACAQQRQMRSAQSVLNVVYRHGLHPDMFTWNSLLVGFAKCQDITGAVNVLRSMKLQGLGVDSSTMAALGHVRAQGRLLGRIKRDTVLAGDLGGPTEEAGAGKLTGKVIKDQTSRLRIRVRRVKYSKNRLNPNKSLKDGSLVHQSRTRDKE